MSTRLEQRRLAKTASFTITYPFHVPGTLFTNRGASGSVTATLPTANAALTGVWYEFRVHADQSFIVAAPGANTLVTLDDSTADNVGYQIAGKKVGRGLRVICDGTSWFAFPYGSLDGFCVDGSEYPFEIGSVKTDSITGTDSSLGITGLAAAQGGAVVATGGASSTAGNAGGAASIVGGAPGATGVGGAAEVTGAAGGATSGTGGAATVTAGAGTAGNAAGGIGSVTGGAGQGSAAGGIGKVAGGLGGATGAGGKAQVVAGAGGATSGSGGDAEVTAGAGTAGNANGGSVVLAGGAKNGTGADGVIIERSVKLVKQGAPTAKTVSATLTAAEVLAGIITVNQAAGATSAQQLPTATDLDTALPAAAAGDAFDFSVINISTVAAEDASVTTNTGWTLVGNMDVASNAAATDKSAGRFRARKTGAAAWTLYRLS